LSGLNFPQKRVKIIHFEPILRFLAYLAVDAKRDFIYYWTVIIDHDFD
jgi:hypothetical protein